MTARSKVLVFDSGLGGLSVLKAVHAARPDAAYLYLADNARFPYGDLEEGEVQRRVVEVVSAAIERFKPDVVVIACNTASTAALSALRERWEVPFVGTVPAIKVAAETTKTGLIGVLATPATVEREYTRDLIETFAGHCTVTLAGVAHLAVFAEQILDGRPVSRDRIATEISSAFTEKDGARTDTVVLGCTHYPLIVDEIAAACPWPVTLIDPSPAIARRVAHFLGMKPADKGSPDGTGQFMSTAYGTISDRLQERFSQCGITDLDGNGQSRVFSV